MINRMEILRNGYVMIAEKLDSEDLHGAMAMAKGLGLIDLVNEIGELMYCDDNEYEPFRKGLITYLIEE
jgi:hypothetical protein